ncbi:MAG: tail fiber protein [bacterium]
MMEPFIGQIIMFAGTFAPRGFAFCEGQILSIMENQALYSLLGTNFGGNGTTTFGLPDLRGRAPIHRGQAPGLSSYSLGQRGGAEQVTLTQNQMPSHTHEAPGGTGSLQLNVNSGRADEKSPAGNFLAQGHEDMYASSSNATMNTNAITSTGGTSGGTTTSAGGSQSHENRSPYLVIHFCIALEGIYPPRS